MNRRGPQSRSRYAPINQSVSMLKNTWLKLACSNEYVTTCQTFPCSTADGIRASHSCIRRRKSGAKIRSIAWPRYIPVHARMMRFTHPAKGGKLNEIVCPRGTNLSFWLRHNRQTAMSCRIDRAHTEYHIILRNLQRCTRPAAYHLDVRPIRSACRAPNHLIGGRASGRFPRQCRVIIQVFGHNFYACRRRRSRRQRGQGRRIQPCHVRHILEVYKFRQVPVFDAVLGGNGMIKKEKIFAEFREAHGSKPLLVERVVVASS